MKKLLLSLFALVATAGIASADTYKRVTSNDEITVGSSYILYAEGNNHYAVMSATPSGTSTPFMKHISMASGAGSTIEVDGTEDYAILELRASERVGHEGHNFFYVMNEGKAGYLTDQPISKKSLAVESDYSNLEDLKYCHIDININNNGNALIQFKDGGKSSIILFNANNGDERFAGYEESQIKNAMLLPYLYKLEDQEEKAPAKPVFTPAKTDIYDTDAIHITGKGTIYYTLNGTTPTKDSRQYTAPFTITKLGETTIKAIAVSNTDPGLVSEVATKTYNVSETPLNYSIVFKNGTTESKELKDNTLLSDVIEEGVEYVLALGHHNYADDNSPIGDLEGDLLKTYFATSKGLKLGSSSSEGAFTIHLNDPVLITDVVVNAAPYKQNESANLEIVGLVGEEETSEVSFGSQALDSSSAELKDYTYSDIEVNDVVVALTFKIPERGYIKSVSIYYKENPVALNDVMLFAMDNSVEEQYVTQFLIVDADENYVDLPGEVSVEVKDSQNTLLQENHDYAWTLDNDENAIYINVVNAGVYTITVNWTGNSKYLPGSASAELTVFAPVLITDSAKGVTYSCNAETATASNGIHTFVFPTGARDHKISLEAPAGAQLHYHIAPVSVGAASAPHRAAASTDVPKGFRPHNGGELTLPGEHGYLQLLTVKNGVTSPVELAYYTNNLDLLDEVTTGAAEIEIDAATAVYYDLNGRRVEADQIKAGVYVRVAGDKVSKVLVK